MIISTIFLACVIARFTMRFNTLTCALYWAIFLGTATLAGLPFILPGGVLNAAIMIANGGRMPVVTDNTIEDGRHFAATPETRFRFLCDRFSIFVGKWSIGDILVFIGLAIWIPLRIMGKV